MKPRRPPKRKRLKPVKPSAANSTYSALWRVVDGAVYDAFFAHPDYLSERGSKNNLARASIVKRVVGAVLGFAEESSKRRSGHPGAG